MVWKIEDLLPKKAIDLLEKNDITITAVGEDEDEICIEIEFFSEFGGDQIFTIWIDKPGVDYKKENVLNKFKDGFYEMIESLDADEYVKMWLNNPDKCPLSARQLVKDADAIEDKLREIYYELLKL